MPEKHSADETLKLSGKLADTFDVQSIHEDISEEHKMGDGLLAMGESFGDSGAHG